MRDLKTPLATSNFGGPKKKKNKAKANRKGGSTPGTRSQLTPAQQKSMVQKIRSLKGSGKNAEADKLKAKLMKERSKGYNKR